MVPGGAVAALFLLSLVPGWIFLRTSEHARKPRQQSSLLELLEVVAVGLATTGISIAFWVLVHPDGILQAWERPETARDIRVGVVSIVVILALAVGLALLASFVYCRQTVVRYELSVWHEMFRRDRVPHGHLPFAAVRLTDGTVAEGVLSTFTPGADINHRDLALTTPIFLTKGGKRSSTSYDLMVLPASEVRSVSIQYAPRSNPQPPPQDRSPRSL